MVYQEQVMQIVRELGGYSFGRADVVRRAMSKKKFSVMEEERKNFIYGKVGPDGSVEVEGAIRRGVDEATANDIFDEMMDFANYAFNKSHAAAYAVITYQTAFLKYFYPAQFMAALLSSVLGDAVKVPQYISDCSRMGIRLLPPDINYSECGFSVDHKSIRFGLEGIKNVGHQFVLAIIDKRSEGKFSSFLDFAQRMVGSEMNKRAIESLIKSGAFDCFGNRRSQLLEAYERILDNIYNDRRTNLSGQISLFAELETAPQDDFKDIPELDKKELLAQEKEMIGIYVSGNPLDDYQDLIRRIANVTTADLLTTDNDDSPLQDNQEVTLVAMLSAVNKKITKSNAQMAFLTIEDAVGTGEVIVFPKVYELYRQQIMEDTVVVIHGRVQIDDERGSKIIAQSIISADSAAHELPVESSKQKLYIKIRLGKDFLVDQLKKLALETPWISENDFVLRRAKIKRLSQMKSTLFPLIRSFWMDYTCYSAKKML